jgi:hypothetical protein
MLPAVSLLLLEKSVVLIVYLFLGIVSWIVNLPVLN